MRIITANNWELLPYRGKKINLGLGSPAINKVFGTPVSATDFSDSTRDSTPDIGAFEYK